MHVCTCLPVYTTAHSLVSLENVPCLNIWYIDPFSQHQYVPQGPPPALTHHTCCFTLTHYGSCLIVSPLIYTHSVLCFTHWFSMSCVLFYSLDLTKFLTHGMCYLGAQQCKICSASDLLKQQRVYLLLYIHIFTFMLQKIPKIAMPQMFKTSYIKR